jgi:hypothetical protein
MPHAGPLDIRPHHIPERKSARKTNYVIARTATHLQNQRVLISKEVRPFARHIDRMLQNMRHPVHFIEMK